MYINHLYVSDFCKCMSMFTQNNNSLPNIRQNSGGGPLADSERTPSGLKFLKSGLEADPKRTSGPFSGSALVLGWVWSVLYKCAIRNDTKNKTVKLIY